MDFQDLSLIEVIGIVAVFFLVFGRYVFGKRRGLSRRGKANEQAPLTPPKNAIVIDGSNVMHWGDGPSIKTLSHVLRSVERAGYAPIVFFDANVGYVLDDHYYNEQKLADLIEVPASHICVVSKGVVADEAILSFATDYRLRVITNDQFRDWRVRFPHAAKKGVLLAGTWRDGAVVWRGQLQKVVRA